MGHGFGATTAIAMAAKDSRVKKVITHDAWMHPIMEQVKEGSLRVTQPHCSVNSEILQH